MVDKKQSVVAIAPDAEQEVIRAQLEGTAEVVAADSDAARGLAAAKQHLPCTVIVYLDAAPEVALRLTKDASRVDGCAPIVVSRARNPDNILVAMRAGARDFAYLEEGGDDVRRSVLELAAIRESVRPGPRGEVITFFSAKGGSGSTTIASNLAGSLATQKNEDGAPLKVILLDFDLEMGDVLVFLDMAARFSYQELLANMHRLDADLLDSSLAKHASGIHVMSQTDYLEEGRELSAEQAGSVIDYLAGFFDFVVIDGLRDFRDVAITALDRADHVVLTMTQDIPALKNANRCLRLFRRLGYEGDKVKLVLNRYRRSGQLNPESIADALGRSVIATVANDFPTAIRAVNEGRLVINAAPNTRLAKDILEMVGVFRKVHAPKRKSIFSLWGKG
ncbi:MAG: AAA family ATPase [Myxococcales bacterium]|jgi:pilus assembly protein CpaE